MKTILITGGSSGFGQATVELLAKDGYKLTLLARRKERLQALQSSLKIKTYAASVDVTDKEQMVWFFANLPAASNSHWIPWLQKQLIIHDISTQTPEIPNAWKPAYETWRKE